VSAANKISNFQAKKNQHKLVCLTAYSFPIAKIIDQFCDLVLVGDSLGMTVYGMPDTTEVSLEMMIAHAKAVKKGIKNALLVVDLPFQTYNSKEQALKNSQLVLEKTGCDAIKIETDASLVRVAEFLVENKIPVMGHVGLLPQSVKKIGGFRYQGREQSQAQEILQTAIALERAGVFSLVIEAVPAILAQKITSSLQIPAIGIGASHACDGQILVVDDVLGINSAFKPKFAKSYENLASRIETAVKSYAEEILGKKFPDKSHEI